MKDCHVEGGPRPGKSNNRNGKEKGRDKPAKGHFETAEDDPDNVEKKIHSVPAVSGRAFTV